eukprot:TRINITY_DN1023_c0_g1_i3.p1 TRINITY_DN1023_c0_g1~~TRINITY_DN1023_c0_g1_i3.p1  ORF type:complete len:972 (-),score=171.84 TRINITY_DN1023_c0_g1_i3:1725-4640(-)
MGHRRPEEMARGQWMRQGRLERGGGQPCGMTAVGKWDPDVARLVVEEGWDAKAFRKVSYLDYVSVGARCQYPSFNGNYVQWLRPSKSLPRCTIAEAISGRSDADAARVQRQACLADAKILCCTANVLTAVDARRGARQRDVGLNAEGRSTALQLQMHAAGITMAGLQEARTSKGYRESEFYHIWSTGAVAGMMGCEPWLRKVIVCVDDSVINIKKNHVYIRHADERRMVAAVRAKGLSLDVAVLHAPHSGAAEYIRDEWWRETRRLCMAHCGAARVCWLIDANTDLPSHTDVTGDAEPYARPKAPAQALEALQECGMKVVTTQSELLRDDDTKWTWQHTSGAKHRLDHIALSGHMAAECTAVATREDIDLSTKRVDHRAVSATFRVSREQHVTTFQRRRPTFDRKVLENEDTRNKIAADIEQVPYIPWDIEPTSHEIMLTQQVVSVCQKHAPVQQGKKAPPSMTDETKAVVKWKAIIHRSWCSADKRMQMRSDLEQELKRAYDVMRKLVRRDKAAYTARIMDDLGNSMAEQDLRCATKALAKLHPYKPRPLPCVKKDGKVAADDGEDRKMWLSHWEERFEGQTTAPLDIVDEVMEQQDRPAKQWGIRDAMLLPTINGVMGRMSRVKKHKAVGNDGLAGELYKLLLRQIAILHHPLYMKIMLTSEDPAVYRGGDIVDLFKPGKVDHANFDSYRAIFVESVAAKVFHGLTRQPIIDSAREMLRPMTVGGVFHGGIDFAIRVAQMHKMWAKAHGRTSAALFLDLTAAFHTVDRERLLGHTLEDTGAPCILKALLRRAHRGLYAAVNGMESMLRLPRGSKPGDPWGDVAFIVAFAEALVAIHGTLDSEQLLDKVPYGDGGPMCAAPMAPCGFTEVSEPTYVDDVLYPLSASNARQLDGKIVRVMQVVFDTLTERGFPGQHGGRKSRSGSVKVRQGRGSTTSGPSLQGQHLRVRRSGRHQGAEGRAGVHSTWSSLR